MLVLLLEESKNESSLLGFFVDDGSTPEIVIIGKDVLSSEGVAFIVNGFWRPTADANDGSNDDDVVGGGGAIVVDVVIDVVDKEGNSGFV